MKRVLLGLAILLSACAPRQAATPELPLTALDANAYHTLADGFTPVFQGLGITVKTASVYAYTGMQEGAFNEALARFYRLNPGFCPLTDAFYPSADQPVYMTLIAKGSEVRGFVYDQGERPKLKFAYLQGTSATTLPTVACR